MKDEQVEKLAAVLYEQGLIIGQGIRAGLSGDEKQASVRDDIRTRFGLKTAMDEGSGKNYGGAGDATPTAPPPTPSNDSTTSVGTVGVVKDEKGEQNLPAGELAQGHVGVTTSTGEKNYGGARKATPTDSPLKEAAVNPFLDAIA
jgi:hypothetical protein